MTDSAADVDCATLHKHMAKHPASGWGILPLQWIEDDWHASVRERHWWWVFRRWACNDVPPGISTNGEGSKTRGWMNQRVLAALQGIRDARGIGDWPRVKFLQAELHDLASRLSIPLYVLGHVTVPNLTPQQNAAIHRVVRTIVKSCDIPAWEKQALHKAVRVVRSNPVTLGRIFAKHSRKTDQQAFQPPCCCAHVQESQGNIMEIDGHKALLPVWVRSHDGTILRPSDTIPIKGSSVRAQLIKDLQRIAQQVGAEVPHLQRMLPPSLWSESGNTLKIIEKQASDISASHYVRIVDKGVGVLWGFCKHWMWTVLHKFLVQEGYTACHDTPAQVTARIKSIIDSNNWESDPVGRIASLYLIGKAKSLVKQQQLWRPIAALPKPLLPKRDLTIAARATTTFLKLLAEEVPGNFMVHSVNHVAAWFHWLPTICCSYLAELDCKDQFNHVPPRQVETHLQQSVAWLAKRRRWRMSEITWSVHKDSKKLDRAGKGASRKFWYVDHTELAKQINFELQNNNFVWAVGSVWQRTGCIPMGGSFSAQSADLHCQWGVYQHRNLFRGLGELRVTDSGFIYWDTPWGALTLCQFRDNILLATSFPDSPSIRVVQRVCDILQRCWSLRVLCPCDDQCTHRCLQRSTVAMGFCMVCGENDTHTAYAHPSSLDSTWALKLGPPLMTPCMSAPKYLQTIFTGVLSNSRQWCRTPLAQLITIAAWVQVARLSGYQPRAICKAMHAAIVRGLDTSQHEPMFAIRFLHQVIPHAPLPRCCALHHALAWVKRKAHWAGERYATWVLPATVAPAGVTGDWSFDYPPLYDHWVSVTPPGHVCV